MKARAAEADMLGEIPMPPIPPAPALLAGGLLCLAVGVMLVVRGRANGKLILALLAAAAAAAAAPAIVRLVPALRSVALVAAAAAVTAGLMGFVLGRLLWGLMLGAILATAALAVAAWIGAVAIAEQPAFGQGQIDSIGGWCGQLMLHLGNWALAMWHYNHAAVAAAAGLATFAVVAGFLLPRITLIVASSFVGAAAMSAGATMLLWAMNLGRTGACSCRRPWEWRQ